MLLSVSASLLKSVSTSLSLLSLPLRVVHFVFALLATLGACVQHPLGLGRRPMGQFSVLLALCHRVLLISTFFSHPPLSEALPGSGAGDITNSKQ